MNPQILNFFKELINRLKTKSPKFFFILQVVAGSFVLLGYVPAMLDRWTAINPSDYFINFCEDVSKYATGILFGFMFTSDSKPTAVTEQGDVVKKLDDKQYPFTSLVEQKKAEKEEVPVIEDPIK